MDHPSVLKRFLDSAYGEHMEFCQLQLNYMDWHFQKCDEKVALCEERQLPVWVMEPLHGGKLCNEPDEMTDELRKMRPDETVTEGVQVLRALPQVRNGSSWNV